MHTRLVRPRPVQLFVAGAVLALGIAGEGEVYTMFVIDEHGLVDTSSLRVLKSTGPAFTSAVRAALPTMRFEPARKDGRAVRQVVQQPFTFALPRNSDGEPRGEVGERDR
jgi:TonB family protein